MTEEEATIEREETGPNRTCIVTRESGPMEGLLRFVAAPDGTVTPDLRRRLPGRGAWVSARRSAVAEAARRRLFARALKRPVVSPDDLAERVEALLARRALESLSLANKAGGVVTGFSKVEAALREGRAVALLHAREAADDGAGRLDALAAALGAPQGRRIAAIRPFSGAEIDLALGRAHVIHAALVAGSASENCLARCMALLAYREDDGFVAASCCDERIPTTDSTAGPTAA